MASTYQHTTALSGAECLAQLSAGGVGRVALTREALPTIELVSYVVAGPDLILTIGAEQGVLRAMDARVIAFETDEIDPADHSGSSVHVVGVASRYGPDAGCGSMTEWDGPGPDSSYRLRLPIGQVRGRRYRSSARDLP